MATVNPPVLLRNARIFDGETEECPEGQQILIEGGVIREISGTAIEGSGAQVIDVGGRTVMPGLIDAHIHAYASDVNVQKIDDAGDTYRTALCACSAMRSIAALARCEISAVAIMAWGALLRIA